MSLIIFLLIVFVAGAFLYETFRAKEVGKDHVPQVVQTADEEMPTQTGRYQAQQIIRSAKRNEQKAKEEEKSREESLPSESELQALPDPFSSSNEDS